MSTGWGRCGLLNSLCVALALIECIYVHVHKYNSLRVKFVLELFMQFLMHGARAGTLCMCMCIIKDQIPYVYTACAVQVDCSRMHIILLCTPNAFSAHDLGYHQRFAVWVTSLASSSRAVMVNPIEQLLFFFWWGCSSTLSTPLGTPLSTVVQRVVTKMWWPYMHGSIIPETDNYL